MIDKTDAVAYGDAARALLGNDIFKDIIAELKRDAYETWAKTDTSASQAREDLYCLHIALGLIEGRIRAIADNGKFEASKQEQAKARVAIG